MEEAEINDDRDRERREDFTSKLKEALGTRMEGLPIADDEEPDVKKDYLTPSFEPYEDDTSIMKRVPEPDNYSTDAYDKSNRFGWFRVVVPSDVFRFRMPGVHRTRFGDMRCYGIMIIPTS